MVLSEVQGRQAHGYEAQGSISQRVGEVQQGEGGENDEVQQLKIILNPDHS